MRKEELTQSIADRLQVPVGQAQTMVETLLHTWKNALTSGKGIEFRGFGSFQPGTRKGGLGVDFATKKSIPLPDKPMVRFKASKTLASAAAAGAKDNKLKSR